MLCRKERGLFSKVKQGLTVIESVEYDVELGSMKKQPDLELLERFCKSDNHQNMVITYEDKTECARRRMSLKAWLNKSEYDTKVYMSVRGSKLYIIRESEQ